LLCEFRQPGILAGSPAEFDRNILAFDETRFAQALAKPGQRLAFGSGEAECRNPMTGIAPAGEAGCDGSRAGAAVAPKARMKSRLFMQPSKITAR